MEEEEDSCLRHLREDRHNDGAVFKPPDALVDVENEVGEGLAGGKAGRYGTRKGVKHASWPGSYTRKHYSKLVNQTLVDH